MLEPYTIIRDTREKDDKGWFFKSSKYCAGTIEEKLDTGDYSLYGWAQHLCIERKGSVAEFAKNLVEDRFLRELDRMLDYPWRYILLEFELSDLLEFPKGTDIPKRRQRFMKLRGPFLLKTLVEIQQKYKIPILFCGDKGQEVCSSICKRFIEAQNG